MSQTNFTSEVQEALTKLMASMILADGRTEKAEVKEAIYCLNNILILSFLYILSIK